MHTIEDALNKLDSIEQNLNAQEQERSQLAEQITLKDQEIALKDDRNAQLHKLFQGTAKIFSKQHDYVDRLKKDLEQEIKDKNLSQEQVKHLQKDIESLDKQKKELLERTEELKKSEKESLKELEQSAKQRDKEIADLKTKIKELTKVKMERQKSEERLKKQTEDFLNVQKMNQIVYDILGKYSDKNGLLLRSREVVEKLDFFESKNFGIDFTGEGFSFLTEEDREEIGRKDLKGEAFFEWVANKYGKTLFEYLNEGLSKVLEFDEKSAREVVDELRKYFGSLKEKEQVCILFEKLAMLFEKYTQELSWWDKWIDDIDNEQILNHDEKVFNYPLKDFIMKELTKRDFELPISERMIFDFNNFSPKSYGVVYSLEGSRDYYSEEWREAIKKYKMLLSLIANYYKNKP